MTPTNNPYLLTIGILIGLFVIGAATYYVNKLFIGEMQSALTKVVVLILVAFSALWICDKLVFLNRNLLQPEQSKDLFDLIKGLILLVFGVHFGTKKEKENGS